MARASRSLIAVWALAIMAGPANRPALNRATRVRFIEGLRGFFHPQPESSFRRHASLRGIQLHKRAIQWQTDTPKFYPAGTGVWQVMPCWAVMAADRGAEPSGEPSAADRRAAA